jgi:hypothetical protein
MRGRRVRIWGEAVALATVLCLWWPATARAYSLLPLVTEQAETLPRGVAETTIGIAYSKDMRFPPFTPRNTLQSQTLVEIPQLGFRIAAGSWAEIEATYETIYLDEQAENGQTNWQFGSGDMRISTKVRLLRERNGWPALGLRFGTKLPNANRSARLGTDDTDFWADALVSKHLGPIEAHVNLGLLLLGNSGPTIGHSFQAGGQDDLVDFAVGVASQPLGRVQDGGVTLRLLGEVAGQVGSRFGNDRSALRIGLQMERGPGRIYIGASRGLVVGSERIGLSAGFIYTFEPGKVFGE